MKKKSFRGTRASRQNFEPRLTAYSTLSVAALATAATASAQIVQFTVSDLGSPSLTLISPITALASVPFVVGPANFGIGGYLSHRTYTSDAPNVFGTLAPYARGTLNLVPGFVPGGGVQIALSGGPHPLNLLAGMVVPSLNNFGSLNQLLRTGGRTGPMLPPYSATLYYNRNPIGNFRPDYGPGGSGYIGFKAVNGGHNYYGWLHITVTTDVDGRPSSVALTNGAGGYAAAYEDILNGSIETGQVSAIPEPASVATGLALFALGAAGVREHRRRRLCSAKP